MEVPRTFTLFKLLKAFKTFLGPVFHEDSESEVRLQKSRPAAKLRYVYYEKVQLKPRRSITHFTLVVVLEYVLYGTTYSE